MTDENPRRDRTESKVRQWAMRMNGEPITNKDVVELVLAVDDDGNDRHRETLEKLDDQHARLIALEEWRSGCPAATVELVSAEHAERHAQHMLECHAPHREGDPPESDYTDERSGLSATLTVADEEMGDMRRAWRVLRWGVAAFVIPIIAAGGYKVAQLIFQ